MPAGLAEIDEGELDDVMHPSQDKRLTGLGLEDEEDAGGQPGDHKDRKGPPSTNTSKGGSRGQYREPFEYGMLLESMGLNLSDHDMAVRYYRERAAPHLVKFPTRPAPEAADPLPEGLEQWDIGMPLEDADWFMSVLNSPHVIPGSTTVQRTWGTTEGATPERRPIDLDLYVDCSGSMPNPQGQTSYLALAGAIIALSALRVGSRVQATLWSGARQFETTDGFITNPQRILQILTGYLGGGTAFPIHMLRDTFKDRKPTDRPVHILVISDDGVTTLFDKDERRNSGWDISKMALEKGRAGGTMVLNLHGEVDAWPDLVRARSEGWQVHRVQTWEDLVEFARKFSQANYGEVKKA